MPLIRTDQHGNVSSEAGLLGRCGRVGGGDINLQAEMFVTTLRYNFHSPAEAIAPL